MFYAKNGITLGDMIVWIGVAGPYCGPAQQIMPHGVYAWAPRLLLWEDRVEPPALRDGADGAVYVEPNLPSGAWWPLAHGVAAEKAAHPLVTVELEPEARAELADGLKQIEQDYAAGMATITGTISDEEDYAEARRGAIALDQGPHQQAPDPETMIRVPTEHGNLLMVVRGLPFRLSKPRQLLAVEGRTDPGQRLPEEERRKEKQWLDAVARVDAGRTRPASIMRSIVYRDLAGDVQMVELARGVDTHLLADGTLLRIAPDADVGTVHSRREAERHARMEQWCTDPRPLLYSVVAGGTVISLRDTLAEAVAEAERIEDAKVVESRGGKETYVCWWARAYTRAGRAIADMAADEPRAP